MGLHREVIEMGMEKRGQSRKRTSGLDSLSQGSAGSQGYLCNMKVVAVKERSRDHKTKGLEDWTSQSMGHLCESAQELQQ